MNRKIAPKDLGKWESRFASMMRRGVIEKALQRAQVQCLAFLAQASAHINYKGEYRAGWMARVTGRTIRFWNKTRQSIFIEEGRGAGKRMPPIAIIRRWALDHGMHADAAFPIAKAIAQRGIKARRVLTAREVRNRLSDILYRCVDQTVGEAVNR